MSYQQQNSGMGHQVAQAPSYSAQFIQKSQSMRQLPRHKQGQRPRGKKGDDVIPNYARPVGYRPEKKRKPSYSNVLESDMTMGVMIPGLRNALAELNHVLYAIEEFEFELLSKKQQGRFGDMLASDARGWSKTVDVFEANAKQMREMQDKIRQDATRKNMHPGNLQSSHYVCTAKGMSSKKYLMLFANGKYHSCEGVEHDSYEVPWYERSIGTWTYEAGETRGKGYRGTLVLREERYTERLDIRMLGIDMDLWRIRMHSLRMPVSRDWQRLGGAYHHGYAPEETPMTNSGNWKRLNKPFNAAKIIYMRSFGDQNTAALRTAGFEVPVSDYMPTGGGYY